jgi:uncharacterized membrane protein YfcA
MELITEFIIIAVLAVFQSVFGVGLLLFGTPAFLFIGYDFGATLVLLLPVSIVTSLLQTIYQKSSIMPLISEFNLFCLPFLFLFLVIAINLGGTLDIRIFVSIFLIISSIVVLNKNRIIRMDKYLLNYRKLYLIFIGSIHGFTNMGGGFLSLFSRLINGEDKLLTRSYISYGYLVMGVTQYATILFIGLNDIDVRQLYYVFLPLVLFFPSQKIFYKIDSQLFMKIINYIALAFGIIVLTISLK